MLKNNYCLTICRATIKTWPFNWKLHLIILHSKPIYNVVCTIKIVISLESEICELISVPY